ncbi:MAG: hypothetical protein ACXAD7_03410 [Candidatus Kariarchaeaceae archaeon]|jgi:hypothetical protein
MKLLKISSMHIKFQILGIVFLMVIGNCYPVYAVEYRFEEDFSDEPDEDWEFGAWNYSSTGSFEQANHTFTYEGELVSGGEPNGGISNYAVKNETTAFGAWSLDIYIPDEPLTNHWGASFAIEFDYLKPSLYYEEPGKTAWPEFNLDGYGNGLKLQVWNKTKDPSSDRLKVEITDSGLKFGTTQHFDIIRTSDTFYVYNDQDLILETEFPSIYGPEINYFAVIAAQGSGVKFDNIKISTDAQGVLDSEGLDTRNPTEDGKSESTSDSAFYAVGVGIVALTGSVSYWRINQKKK